MRMAAGYLFSRKTQKQLYAAINNLREISGVSLELLLVEE